MKAAHSLCTATVSTVDIKKQLTDRSKKLTAWSRVLLEKMTVPQLVTNFITWINLYEPYRQYSSSQMHTYLRSFLSVRYHKLHTRTTSTQLTVSMHCATPSTPSLAIPTQSADSSPISTVVCRSLILKLYIRLPLWRKYKMNKSNRRTANLFHNQNNRYVFRPTAVIISTAGEKYW